MTELKKSHVLEAFMIANVSYLSPNPIMELMGKLKSLTIGNCPTFNYEEFAEHCLFHHFRKMKTVSFCTTGVCQFRECLNIILQAFKNCNVVIEGIALWEDNQPIYNVAIYNSLNKYVVSPWAAPFLHC